MASLYQPHDQEIRNTDAVVLPGDNNPMEAYEKGKESAFNLKLASYNLAQQRLADQEKKTKLTDYNSAFKQIAEATKHVPGGIWSDDLNKKLTTLSDSMSREWTDTGDINPEQLQRSLQPILADENKVKGIYAAVDKYTTLEAKSYPGLDAGKMKGYFIKQFSDGVDKDGNLNPKDLDKIGNVDDLQKQMEDDPATLAFFNQDKIFYNMVKTLGTQSTSNTTESSDPLVKMFSHVELNNKGDIATPDNIAPTQQNMALLVDMNPTKNGAVPIAKRELYDYALKDPGVAQILHLDFMQFKKDNPNSNIDENSPEADIIKRQALLANVAPEIANKVVKERKYDESLYGWLMNDSVPQQKKDKLLDWKSKIGAALGNSPTYFHDIYGAAKNGDIETLDRYHIPSQTYNDPYTLTSYTIHDLTHVAGTVQTEVDPASGKKYTPRVWTNSQYPGKVFWQPMVYDNVTKKMVPTVNTAEANEDRLRSWGYNENKYYLGQRAVKLNIEGDQTSAEGQTPPSLPPPPNTPPAQPKPSAGQQVKNFVAGRKATTINGVKYFTDNKKRIYDNDGNQVRFSSDYKEVFTVKNGKWYDKDGNQVDGE
jgi:hypothetical protein